LLSRTLYGIWLRKGGRKKEGGKKRTPFNPSPFSGCFFAQRGKVQGGGGGKGKSPPTIYIFNFYLNTSLMVVRRLVGKGEMERREGEDPPPINPFFPASLSLPPGIPLKVLFRGKQRKEGGGGEGKGRAGFIFLILPLMRSSTSDEGGRKKGGGKFQLYNLVITSFFRLAKSLIKREKKKRNQLSIRKNGGHTDKIKGGGGGD